MEEYNTYKSNTISFQTYLEKVFITVGIGLLISAITSYFTYKFNQFLTSSFILIACIAELVVAIYFASRLRKMSKNTAWTCYILYSVLTGISLSSIFMVYSYKSITFAFLSTVILFACMAIIGHTTKKDLTSFSTLLFSGLMAMIIVSLINVIFFKSEVINYYVSFIGVIIFLVITAYDVQKLQNYYYEGNSYSDMSEKIMIYGAFQLYLDFINLFLRILEIFSRRNRD